MFVLEGHQGDVGAVVFSPDGQTLATAGKDGIVRLWEPPLAKAELTGPEGRVLRLAFSSDGAKLAAGSADRTVRVWDLARPGSVQRTPGQPQPITGLAFLPDDQTLIVACGDPSAETHMARSLFRWDVAHWKPRASDDIYETQGVRALAAHVPQRLLAYALDRRRLVVRDLVRPTPVYDLPTRNLCTCLALSPDGKTLAAGLDWKVQLFDLERKQERATLSGHKGLVSSIAFSPDGRTLMSGGGGDAVKLWDVASGRERQTFHWPIGRVCSVAFAPDGLRAAAGGGEGKVAVWDADE